MADELKRIEALYGPYAGRHLDVAAADADQAISDGWARDPYTPRAEATEFDQEKYDAMLIAADKAARKLRGEQEPAAPAKKEGKAKDKPLKEEDRAATAKPEGSGSTYQTRRVTTKE